MVVVTNRRRVGSRVTSALLSFSAEARPQIEGMPFGWWAHLRRKYLNSPRRASPRFGCRRQIKPRTTSRWATILDQKGSVATWFGKKDELISLIGAAHDAQMQVYADF